MQADITLAPDADPTAWMAFLQQGAAAMDLALTDEQARQFWLHAVELVRWNRKINLTAITDPEAIAVKHFLDSLMPLRFLEAPGSLLDIGTGGGFPGLVLKVMRPDWPVVLLDSAEKKINFCRQVMRRLGLSGIEARHQRAEELAALPAYQGAFEVVVARAFAALEAIVTMALPLLAPGGQIIALKGPGYKAELAALKQQPCPGPNATRTLADFFQILVYPYVLYHLGDQRVLLILTRRRE